MKRFLWVFLFLFFTGCATGGEPGSTSKAPENFTVKIPEQWIRLNLPDSFMCSKDGPFEQYIYIQQRHVSDPFPHAKKSLTSGMKPAELAELLIREISSDPGILDLQVIDSRTAKVNHHDGFKMLFTYKVKDGNSFKTLYYGFLLGDWYYGIRYNADVSRYSDDDVRRFEEMVKSLVVKGA
jgi:hypothetical protein